MKKKQQLNKKIKEELDSLVFLYEPMFKIIVLHVKKNASHLYKDGFISFDSERKEVWLEAFYLGEL